MRLGKLMAAAVLLAGCHDPVDQAAKARIFSPEDPPKFVTRAAEGLDPAHLDQSAEHIRRVFTMSAREASERLGPHELKSTLEFTWKSGAKTIALDETHALTLGTHGDFAARLDAGDRLGDSRQGMEMVRTHGKVFARSRFQKFRERSRDRGAADRDEEQVYDVLGTTYALFDGRVALTPDGEVTIAGRRAIRYQVLLAEKVPQLAATGSPPPPPLPPRTGLDRHLVRQLDLDKKKEPRSLTGTLAVDAELGVALEAKLVGTLDAPGEGAAPSTLRLAVEQHTLKIDPALVVAAPKDALLDEGRPQSIAAALTRFDLPRAKTADAGAGSEADDPDDEK